MDIKDMHPNAQASVAAATSLEPGQSATVISTVPGVGVSYAAKEAFKALGLTVSDIRCDMLFETDFNPIPYPTDDKGGFRFTERTASLHAVARDSDVVIFDYCKGAMERLPTVGVFEQEMLAAGKRVLHIVTDHGTAS